LREPYSLPEEYVKNLWAGKDGKLWIGGYGGSLAMFDPDHKRFTEIPLKQKLPEHVEVGVVVGLAGDNQGGIWIAGESMGVAYFTPADGKLKLFRHENGQATSLLDNRIKHIMLDRHGNLWVSSHKGLQKLPAGKQEFELVASQEHDLNGLAEDGVKSIFEAQDGKLWLGLTKNGAARLDPANYANFRVSLDTKPANVLTDNVVDIIAQPHPDEIWMSRYGYGIYVVNAKTGKITHRLRNDPAIASSLALDQIGAMLTDQSGLLWIGTWGNGLQKHMPTNDAISMLRHSPNYPTGLTRPNIRSILETRDGKFLFGTEGNGIDIIDRNAGLIGGYRPSNDKDATSITAAVLALAQTDDGSIWAGTRQSGLKHLKPGDTKWRTFSTADGLPANQTPTLFVSKDDTLWVGTYNGFARYLPQQKKFETMVLPDGTAMAGYVTAITEDAQGQIWAGSEKGVWNFNPKTKVLKQIIHRDKVADSLVFDDVNGLLIDHSGRLWIDTSQGLDLMTNWDGERARFSHISEKIGRPGLYFGGNLMEDKLGRIWTQWFVFDPQTKKLNELFKSNGIDVGTPWIGSYQKTHDGHFLFGGTKGVAIIRPEQYQTWTYQASVAITSLKIDGLEQDLASIKNDLKITPDQRHFEIEFAALDYLIPLKNRYAYRLLGYQNEWIETDAEHRNVNYGNLWPGRYVLQLKASNNQGRWSSQEISLTIRILPAFWQTSWFIALVLLSFGGSVIGVYRWRIRRIDAEKHSLQEIVNKRTADILKLNEIGQSLTATLDIEQAFLRIHQQVIARVDAFVFGIGFCDQAFTRIDVDYMVENGIRQAPFEYGLHEIGRPAVWCILHERELVTDTTDGLLHYLPSIAPVRSGSHMESIVYMPLFVEEKVIGCMTVQSPRQNAYTEDQVAFLRALANYVAIAVANSQAHRHLLDTQRQLAQQEKMASLGQLVANVAHEINTPIGAIKSSGSNIADSLNLIMTGLAELMFRLDQSDRQLFLDLIVNIAANSPILNTREERRIVAETQAHLTALQIADSRRMATILVQLRAHNQIEQFIALLRHTECERIMNTANEIAAIINNTNNIQVAVERVSKIVFAFKSFSRIGSNSEKILSHLREGMETVLTLYQNKINKGTELICHFEDIPPILCWPDELVQVWVNLIHNALQAMNYQGTLTISIHQQAGSGGQTDQAVVSVTDTGSGIPEHLRNKIFDVFFTTKPVGEGSGLGLDIVKKIIKKHGGHIEFESEIDQGTTFSVYLPYS
jgi:signal transduction histidine kinase/ligand-binding sensor domain-containing protein